MSTELEPALVALIDDAATFPPGNADLDTATAAHLARRDEPWADLVGSFVVRDIDLPRLQDTSMPVSVVVSGGAGQIEGPAALCRRLGLQLTGIEVALREPDDLVGNARRVVAAVDAARTSGALEEDVPVYVELPHAGSTSSWLAAADELAAVELRLKFRTGGLEPEAFPAAHALARWIDAALDRETPFKCTAGLHHAVRNTSPEGFEQHGFLNVLAATVRAFDGASTEEVVEVLESRDGGALVGQEGWLNDLGRARRWFTSFGSCSVDEPLADLRGLGLLQNTPRRSSPPPLRSSDEQRRGDPE